MVEANFWIGHPGALLPLPDLAGSLGRTVERGVNYTTSASGNRRAYLSASRAPLREWKVSIPAMRPDEAAILHGLLMETDPPYLWIDPWSRVTNLLTPRAAGMESSIPALQLTGRQPLDGGGYAPTAATNPTAVVVKIEPAPVLPGRPVTVSAYLASAAGAIISAVFLDSNGAAVGLAVASPAVVGTSVLRRAFVSIPVPPVNAVAVSIHVSSGASVIAQPAVTWTAGLVEYGAGGGAAQVIVTGLDEAIEIASDEALGQRYASMSFTVTEVG